MANGTFDTASVGTRGQLFTTDGSSMIATTNPAAYSMTKLFTLNSNWSSSTKFAFEATFSTAAASCVVYVDLYDITTNTMITEIRSTSTTFSTIRSEQFTLIPGHSYGVSAWVNIYTAGNNAYITDASLVVFG